MSNEKGKQRRFTTEEKRVILAEAEQPGVTITLVCRKHRIAATQFYRWRCCPGAQNRRSGSFQG